MLSSQIGFRGGSNLHHASGASGTHPPPPPSPLHPHGGYPPGLSQPPPPGRPHHLPGAGSHWPPPSPHRPYDPAALPYPSLPFTAGREAAAAAAAAAAADQMAAAAAAMMARQHHAAAASYMETTRLQQQQHQAAAQMAAPLRQTSLSHSPAGTTYTTYCTSLPQSRSLGRLAFSTLKRLKPLNNFQNF